MNTTIPTPPTTPPESTPASLEQKRRNFFNILAIVGFLVVIILVAWLSIQVVKVLPGAFSSLANLAETLRGDNSRTIAITGPEGEVTTDTEITLAWEAAPVPGTYTFSYDCVDGVSIEIRKNDTTREVRCDTTYSLGEDTLVRLFVTSDELDSASVPYRVTFLRTNDTTARLTGEGQFTVRRDDAVVTEPIPEERSETESDIVVTPTPAPIPSAPASPRASTPAPTQNYTYSYVPVSDPTGSVDLAVRMIAVGTVSGSTFTPRTTLLAGRENAMRFEIKNHGTKTSGEWSYVVNLPDGSTYQASEQKPLKPNERATITMTFALPSDVTGSVRTSVAVDASGDRTSINDRFVETVRVTR